MDLPSPRRWPHMITFIAVHGDCGPVTLHARRAPWSVFQDGTVPLAYARGAGGAASAPALNRSGAGGPPLARRGPGSFPAPTRVSLRSPCSLAGGCAKIAPCIAGRVTPDNTGDRSAAHRARPSADRARITRRGQGGPGRLGFYTSGAHRSTPAVPLTRYSEPAAELRGRLRSLRLDALLALLTECFSEFPHGTYLLSVWCFEI